MTKPPKLEKNMEIPTKFTPPTEDKYNLELLQSPGDALFFSFKEWGDGTKAEEKNLRANLFFHIRKHKEKTTVALVCRKDYEDQSDDTSQVGFRVFYPQEKKPGKKR